MDKSPDELWTLIVGGDIKVYRNLIRACPQFARLTLSDNSYWKKIFTRCERWSDGSERWCLANRPHRENDLPAIIFSGHQAWYFCGRLHREGGMPAVMWYIYGRLHRGWDQPAVTWPDGGKEWWSNGLRHRGGGQPAVIRGGHKEWWIQGVIQQR